MKLRDILVFPQVEKKFFKIWKRNFLFFKRTLLVSVFWIVLEPVMYLWAFGFGLGAFVDTINGKPFLEFFFPGLLCITAMMVPFFESTYSSYTKLTHQKTFTSILLTPLGAPDIVFAEIVWSASKGLFGLLGVLIVSSFFGLITSWNILLAFLVLVILCWLFASLGMLVTSMAKNYDSFIYATSGFIVPMSLVSGTYFPIDHMSTPLAVLAYTLPLTHGISLVRGILESQLSWIHLVNLIYLMGLGWITMNLSINRITRKILN